MACVTGVNLPAWAMGRVWIARIAAATTHVLSIGRALSQSCRPSVVSGFRLGAADATDGWRALEIHGQVEPEEPGIEDRERSQVRRAVDAIRLIERRTGVRVEDVVQVQADVGPRASE